MIDQRLFGGDICSMKCPHLKNGAMWMNDSYCAWYKTSLVYTNFYPIRCEKCREDGDGE